MAVGNPPRACAGPKHDPHYFQWTSQCRATTQQHLQAVRISHKYFKRNKLSEFETILLHDCNKTIDY